MIILRLLLLLTNLHLKLLSTQGTGADKLLSTQRVNREDSALFHKTHRWNERLVISREIMCSEVVFITET